MPRVGNAVDVYRWYAARGRISTGVPPTGSLVFYDIAWPWGQVALSVGGSQVVSTRGLDGARLPNQLMSYRAFCDYLGWAMP